MKLNREKFGPCIAEVGERAGVDDDEAFNIIQTVAEHGQRLRNQGEVNPFGMAAKTISEAEVDAASRTRADVLRNAMVRNMLLDHVEAGGGMKKGYATLRDYLLRIQAQWKGNAGAWAGVFEGKLRAEGLDKAFKSGLLDEQIADARYATTSSAPMPDSVSAPAKRIAELMGDTLDHIRTRLNAAGANIDDAEQYIAHTSHDVDKMRGAAGFNQPFGNAQDAWVKFIRPLLGEKTWADLEPREGESMQDTQTRFLQGAYNAIYTGLHLSQTGKDGVAAIAPYFGGSANLARKLAEGRTFFFKGGAAWNTYMQRFGREPTLAGNVVRSIDEGAKHLALLEGLGTNPKANLALVADKIATAGRNVDPVTQQRFTEKSKFLHTMLAQMDGSIGTANRMAAQIGETARTIQYFGTAGGIGVTHFASVWPTIPSELAHHGISRLGALGNLAHAIAGGLEGAEHQKVLADMGAYADGLQHDMTQFAGNALPGKLSSLASVYTKFTVLPYILSRAQNSVRDMLGAELGRNVGKPLADMDPHLQQMLPRYGITGADWDMLRQGELMHANGRGYLTPSTAGSLDSGLVEQHLRDTGVLKKDTAADTVDRLVQHYKWQLSDKLLSYYSDAAAHGTVTPGIEERALAFGMSQPGSIGGEFRRFFAQYKMWPLAVMNQVLRRDITRSLSAKEAGLNIFSLLALTTAGGYIRSTINDLAGGRGPRNPLDPAVLLTSLGHGGGLGLFGDILLGETNRMTGWWDGLMGPTLGDVGKVGSIFNQIRGDLTSNDLTAQEHAWKNAWPETMRLGVHHVPFANLAYLKGTLDYLLWYHLYEAASPGWWDRTNQRMEREQGRTMLGYRPGGTVPYPTDLLTQH